MGESQLCNLKKKGPETGSQVIRLSGSHPTKTNNRKKQQLEMLGVESFTASTVEPRTVQLRGGGASAITKALNPYGVTLPLLTQPAVAEATHRCQDNPQ